MSSRRLDTGRLVSSSLVAVVRALTSEGATVRMVGGCVRNSLLGEALGDIDLAIDVPPEESEQLLKSAGIYTRPVGKEFGTIQAVAAAGERYDVTSLRRDVDTDGRWPVVSFGTDWAEDARRRDFTMNALYAGFDGSVFDPVGGLPDVLARRVRFIGDADTRIREDYLRILRFFRLVANYGSESGDSETLRACAAHREALHRLSGYRVGREMRKWLASPDPTASLKAANDCGVLQEVLPGANLENFRNLIDLELRHEIRPEWMRRWLFLYSGPIDLTNLRFALSGAEYFNLDHRRFALASLAPVLEIAHRNGWEATRDALLVRAARGETREILQDLEEAWRGAGTEFPIGPSDLLDAGFEEGPGIGAALRRARQYWLDHDLEPGRADLIGIAMEAAP